MFRTSKSERSLRVTNSTSSKLLLTSQGTIRSKDDSDLKIVFPTFASGRNILTEGNLQKRGSWGPFWKTRYFVLESSGRLFYFKLESDKFFPERARGCIPINVNVTLTVGKGTSGKWGTIDIKLPRDLADGVQSISLASNFKEEFDRWLVALKEAKNNVLYVDIPHRK